MTDDELKVLKNAYNRLKNYEESDKMEDMRMDIVKLQLELAQTQRDLERMTNRSNSEFSKISKLPTRSELWMSVIAIVVPLILLIVSK